MTLLRNAERFGYSLHVALLTFSILDQLSLAENEYKLIGFLPVSRGRGKDEWEKSGRERIRCGTVQ